MNTGRLTAELRAYAELGQQLVAALLLPTTWLVLLERRLIWHPPRPSREPFYLRSLEHQNVTKHA